MLVQEIIAFSLLAIAIGFLVRKFFWKKKSKKTVETGIVGVVKSLYLYVICPKQFSVLCSNGLKTVL